MQELSGKRVLYKGRIFKIQSVFKLGQKYSVLGFWEVDGKIPKNSHVDHLTVLSLDEMKLLD